MSINLQSQADLSVFFDHFLCWEAEIVFSASMSDLVKNWLITSPDAALSSSSLTATPEP